MDEIYILRELRNEKTLNTWLFRTVREAEEWADTRIRSSLPLDTGPNGYRHRMLARKWEQNTRVNCSTVPADQAVRYKAGPRDDPGEYFNTGYIIETLLLPELVENL